MASLLLLVACCLLLLLWNPGAAETCDKQRKVLTGSHGTFSDGLRDYPEDSYCEWLIVAPSPSQFITLYFDSMDTECSYDHLFVYDGSSYNSTLLASLSGSSLPPPITARSGHMLLMLYSDTNYVRQGFQARWAATDCPMNCSSHGSCDSHFCVCAPLWTGEACEAHLCPGQCGEAEGRGHCELNPVRCVCAPKWTGEGCDLPEDPQNASWYLLAQEGRPGNFSPRASHAAAYVPFLDRLFLFGGLSFEGVLGDLLAYDLNQSQWANLTGSTPRPSPRWGHAMAAYGNNLVIHGGQLTDGSFSPELWMFDVVASHWILPDLDKLGPTVAKHTLTVVEDWIYVFGGLCPDGQFSSDIYRINLREADPLWENVEARGGKPAERRLVGHSAVYYAPARSLLIYGGMAVDYARFSKLSDQIHAFHVDERVWSRLAYPRGGIPLERAFHSMVLVQDYLVVFGGYIHRHSHQEGCYDPGMYLYDLVCHRWVPLAGESLGPSPQPGLFAHTASLRRGNHTLLVAGGYSGVMRAALWARLLPPSVTARGRAACQGHQSKEECRANLRCGWCPHPGGEGSCLEREALKECSLGLLSQDTCPGPCSALQDCRACLLWGPGNCKWHSGPRACLTPDVEPKPGGAVVEQVEQCVEHGVGSSGLTSVKYSHPIDWSQPDDVGHLNSSAEELYFHLQSQRDAGESMARLLGFLRPQPRNTKLFLRSSGGRATLLLSNSSSLRFLEVVANHSGHTAMRTEAHRLGRGPLFPSAGRYLVDVRLSIPPAFNTTAILQLLWSSGVALRPTVVESQFLEPYSGNGSCDNYSTCLACLMDARCGWCPSGKCKARDSGPCPEDLLAVLEPSQCPKCSDHIYCRHCVQEPSCEWQIEESQCVRRGRSKDSVRHPQLCPQDCYQRSNCTSCLGDPGRCAWCQETQECFLFATYTTAFMFGRCREWVDEERAIPRGVTGGQCRDCSRHLDCRGCLRQLSCGWCSNDGNLSMGFCAEGDYSRPHSGSCQNLAPASFGAKFSWWYTGCPDIDECALGLHSCHQQAFCTNTPDSYLCTCKPGYRGDGIASCQRTCVEECVHGICSEAPDYVCRCNVGWTGPSCSQDCGCHNHSHCNLAGPGFCDQCSHWTEGQFCDKCRVGSFGNATLPQGCQPCQCNGHEEAGLGICNRQTGECYCDNTTSGLNCEHCLAMYYGDPRNGGHCYHPCLSRGVLTAAKLGRLGSYHGDTNNSHCLWVVVDGPLELSVHQLNVPCPYNHIYVYDGYPGLVSQDNKGRLLSAVCGQNLTEPVVLRASSGVLSIYYHRSPDDTGFNATYRRIDPDSTPEPSSTPCNESCLELKWEHVGIRPASLPTLGYSLHSHSSLLWLFGGYSLSQEAHSNLLWVFNTSQPQGGWQMVTPSGESNGLPPKRHFHAAAMLGPNLYIHGGLGAEGVLWSDFWRFHTRSLAWSPLNAGDVPPLAGHTLTPLPDGNSLLLVGGYSPNYGFLERVLLFNASTLDWSTFNTSGAPPVGIYGHSALLREDTLYVFGGVVFGGHRPAVAPYLHALHLPSRRWTRLPPDRALNLRPPAPAYLHSVVLPSSRRHMVLLGAGTPLTFYSFPCNLWIFPQVQDSPRQDVGSRAVLGSDHAVWMLTEAGLHRLQIPPDLCQLFSHSQQECLKHHGCSFCSAYEAESNSTFCYSEPKLPSSCSNPKGTSELVRGVVCTPSWLSDRECYQYSSCVDCVAFWPAINSSAQVCQWCSNCQVGRCVPQGASCEKENDCNVPQKVVGQPGACPRHVCLASDCPKCGGLPGDSCMWTRQVLRASEWGHTLNVRPIFDWACVRRVIQEATSFPVESMPPLTCPALCPAHMDCAACVASSGGEGGWSHCHWSTNLRQCVSPSFQPLACVGGRCGSLLSRCPPPCWTSLQASHCLRNPGCGWCHFAGVDGRGVCLPGSMEGPLHNAACSPQSVHLPDGLPLPDEAVKWLAMSQEPPQWAYLEIPPENECTNGHHNCIDETEDCQDLPAGYKCLCKKGFTQDPSDVCVPVCSQGCKFGTCVAPDECKCDFGYVGKNCSVQCQCNRHSQCAAPDRLDECLDCQNNTQGPQCQQCKPFFVGDPVNGGSCLPCRVYCNGHSEVCLSPEQYNLSSPSLTPHILDSLTAGPVKDAVCLDCRNATEGPRCDQCLPGYFKAGDSISDGCRPCECHGHGDMCNPTNGENCNCHNNTENDRQCSQKTSKSLSTPCWQLQCSKCKEYFVGVPTHGHQCYRHMFLDKDYCFDPYTQEQCNRKPNPLPEGRTVFFAVQPRYMNVDIRIIVDVTDGAVDFFLSARDDTFVVAVNQSTGVHEVRLEESNQTLVGRRVEAARGLTTYLTISDSREFLLVNNLRHRLVVTVPLEVHDLRSVKFFMVLYGASPHPTYGSLFFRQDQTRIDLFVFFSVFFSCFFLFLAQCVIMWKVKQAFDVRRVRRQHAAEMKHMANRPFGRVAVIVEGGEVEELFCYTPPSTFSWKRSRHKVRDSPKTSPALLLSADKFCTVWPVAVEPITDNFAGVATVLVQLPGGPNAPVKMCLGSALVTMRSCHQRARRRTS